MINLYGIELPHGLPYEIIEVGTLLFAEYPTTLIYSDKNGNPVIKEWVDCSTDNSIDRFYFYSVDKQYLKKFIERTIPHIELINSASEKYVIFQDIENGNPIGTKVISIDKIPPNYKPAGDFYFDKEDGVDLEAVVGYFGLNKLEDEETVFYAKEIGKKENSETIYIHLNSGKGIGYGRISTEVYGKTLMNIDRFYKSVALDHIKGIGRGELSLDAQSNLELRQFTDTEIFSIPIRASYGFFIKPIVIQSSFFGETESEKIARRAFDLISKSQDTELLKEEYLLHSGYTISSYKTLLEAIYKLHIKMNISWYNPSNEKQIKDNIDYLKANRIIRDIESLSQIDSQEFKATGKFRAINCNTRHFTFISTSDEEYSGYFDKLLRDGLVGINFIDIYEISLTRKIINEAENNKEKIQDTIVAYYPVEEN